MVLLIYLLGRFKALNSQYGSQYGKLVVCVTVLSVCMRRINQSENINLVKSSERTHVQIQQHFCVAQVTVHGQMCLTCVSALPRTHLVRSVAVSTTRACLLALAPPTGEYGRKAWWRTTTTMMIPIQTPAPQGQTPIAKAAPSPDSLDRPGLQGRP